MSQESSTKIAVIGPGAMGCLFAARLQEASLPVTLVDHDPARAQRLKAAGVTVEASNGSFTTYPEVVSSVPPDAALRIVLVKAHHTAALELESDGPVLTLQNGLNNVETLCSKVGARHVLAGVTCEAATLLGEGRVRHVASGLTKLGAWTSCPTHFAEEALRAAGFDVEVTEAPGQAIWEKVAINAGINPLTALLDVPNGRLLELREARQLMRDLVVEAVKVASTEGYRFDHSLVERTEEVCRETGENISSMLQDIRAGKQTEIEAISGEIQRRGQRAALPTPRTRVVWQLVRSLESR